MIDRKKNEAVHMFAVGAVASLVLIGVLYTDHAMQYRTRFLPNTYINDLEVAGLTTQEVEEKLGEYRMQISFREGQTAVIDGTDIDYHYVSDGTVEELLQSQNPLMWLPSEYGKTEHTIDSPTTFDGDKLNTVMAEIPQLNAANMAAPVDAYVGYAEQNHAFEVVPEYYGTTLDTAAAENLIREAVVAEQTELDLTEAEGLYENPDVFSDNEILHRDVEVLNELAGASITYDLPGEETVTLAGPELKEWLLQDEDGNYYRDDALWNEKIRAFISGLAEKVNTVYSEHDFKNHDGDVIKIAGEGYYGYLLNQKEEIAQLTEELQQNTVDTRTPIWKRTEAAEPDDNYGWGGTYCEVNLTQQHLWIYKDYEMVLETDVVSGTNDRKHRTPGGAYFIYDKKRNTVLKGDKQEDGSWGYETPVKYWMRVTGDGIGLHDASWRSSFGGNIWRWSGSHGCVNLPSSLAGEIYDLLEDGTPVAIYYEED